MTIILTTHYIEEAEAIADRVGVINKGEILLVEEKSQPDAAAWAQKVSCEVQLTEAAWMRCRRRLTASDTLRLGRGWARL